MSTAAACRLRTSSSLRFSTPVSVDTGHGLLCGCTDIPLAVSLVTDLVFAILPTIFIRKVQMARKTKLCVIPVLSLGFLYGQLPRTISLR